MKEQIIKILKKMYSGKEITFRNGYTYTIIDGELCMKIYDKNNNDAGYIQGLATDIPINTFIKMCNALLIKD